MVGEGPLREAIENEIKKNNLENDVILLGAKENPYPFFKGCDLYVQTSRFEGYCMALREAILFKKPIITTNFESANEQIINVKNGMVTDMDENSMYKMIKKVIIDKILRSNLSKNLNDEYISINKVMDKLYTII